MWHADVKLTKEIDGIPAGTPAMVLSEVDENGIWTSSGVKIDVQFEDGSTMIIGFEDAEPYE